MERRADQQPYFAQPPSQPPKKKRTGWWIGGFGCLGVVVAFIVVAVAVGSGAGTSLTVSPDDNTPVGGHSAATAAKPAGLGDTIDVTDSNGGKLAVTLIKVVPGAKGADEFNAPDAGKQFVAVQLRIKNVGTSAWSDSPDNCVQLRDGSGQQFNADLDNVSVGQSFAGSASLTPGSSVLGVEVFQLPSGDKLGLFQFQTDSGMGPGIAQWTLA
ncbi:DUF4352 domain-containing protein [Actinospica robiniae]|uniref:DUF4352 domain-containing protein n=1 Tax=Actinospica robiniae TaxID=304901 RepID=UPI000408F609|nr:DUF4352 domain-containing protein [Actinospica robiniae]